MSNAIVLSTSVNTIFLSVLTPASSQARAISSLTNYFFVAAGAILLVVSLLTAWYLYKYRGKDNDEDPESKPINHRVEYLMIGIPLLLVIVFFTLTIQTMLRVLPTPADNTTPDIVITGHQWWWEVYYPKEELTTANEIHLPAGEKLLLAFRSADVIHDWWIPELGNKMDVIPGVSTYSWLTIDKPGRFEGACSEFCGQQHAWMRIKLYAENKDDFKLWVKAQQKNAASPQSPMARKGEQLFNELTCKNCHATDHYTAEDSVNTGPDLTHLASRKTILTGLLPNDSVHIRQWLQAPQRVKPGGYMPDFNLNKDELDALTVYLTALK